MRTGTTAWTSKVTVIIMPREKELLAVIDILFSIIDILNKTPQPHKGE